MKHFFITIQTHLYIEDKVQDCINFSTYYIQAKDEAEATQYIKKLPPITYKNINNHTCQWRFHRIQSIDQFSNLSPSKEVSGFIVSPQDLQSDLQNSTKLTSPQS